jgi:hypothetical protein
MFVLVGRSLTKATIENANKKYEFNVNSSSCPYDSASHDIFAACWQSLSFSSRIQANIRNRAIKGQIY